MADFESTPIPQEVQHDIDAKFAGVGLQMDADLERFGNVPEAYKHWLPKLTGPATRVIRAVVQRSYPPINPDRPNQLDSHGLAVEYGLVAGHTISRYLLTNTQRTREDVEFCEALNRLSQQIHDPDLQLAYDLEDFMRAGGQETTARLQIFMTPRLFEAFEDNHKDHNNLNQLYANALGYAAVGGEVRICSDAILLAQDKDMRAFHEIDAAAKQLRKIQDDGFRGTKWMQEPPGE